MRWANGSGTTTEIAVHPADATLDSFAWRVSLARMVEDAAFSVMPDVDRTLLVVHGHGIDLAVGSRRPCRLGRSSEPFGFSGDLPAFARLVSGPVSNLNVMTRRGRGRHHVQRLRVAGTVELPTTGLTIIHAVGALTAGDLALADGDTAIVGEPSTCVRLHAREADAIVIRLQATGAGSQ